MTADQLNRPSANPGGMECQTCGRIFIGDESHSECGLCHNTRPTAVASHAEGEVVAWLDPETDDVITSKRKSEWLSIYGAGGVKKANAYTIPLYTHPPRSVDEAQARISNVVRQIRSYAQAAASTEVIEGTKVCDIINWYCDEMAHDERTVKENLTVGDEAQAKEVAYWKDRAHAAEDNIASQPIMDACRHCDDCAPYLKEGETPVQRIERERKDVTGCLRLLRMERTLTDIDRMVNRFLAWPLPSSVCPDGCVMNRDYPYRVGTNLLTAAEAKAMFIHALGRDAAMAEAAEGGV